MSRKTASLSFLFLTKPNGRSFSIDRGSQDTLVARVLIQSQSLQSVCLERDQNRGTCRVRGIRDSKKSSTVYSVQSRLFSRLRRKREREREREEKVFTRDETSGGSKIITSRHEITEVVFFFPDGVSRIDREDEELAAVRTE